MSKKILALDLGTTAGFACGDAEHHISGTWSLAQSRFDGGGMRFVKFRGRLNEALNAYRFEIVYYEEVRRHIGVDAAHVYGGLQAVLQSWCEENRIAYQGVPVGTIKKFATGYGNAKKERMIEAAIAWGYCPVDHNEADAIALFRWGLAQAG